MTKDKLNKLNALDKMIEKLNRFIDQYESKRKTCNGIMISAHIEEKCEESFVTDSSTKEFIFDQELSDNIFHVIQHHRDMLVKKFEES